MAVSRQWPVDVPAISAEGEGTESTSWWLGASMTRFSDAHGEVTRGFWTGQALISAWGHIIAARGVPDL